MLQVKENWKPFVMEPTLSAMVSKTLVRGYHHDDGASIIKLTGPIEYNTHQAYTELIVIMKDMDSQVKKQLYL